MWRVETKFFGKKISEGYPQLKVGKRNYRYGLPENFLSKGQKTVVLIGLRFLGQKVANFATIVL